MSDLISYPVSIYRGGTSKVLIFNPEFLPATPAERDKVILNAYGSPDPRQIDGMGGADSLTSKVGMVCKSLRDDADVDYTFGQVSIHSATIDYTGNCGNISSAVGLYAVDMGLVPVMEGTTRVRIYNTNTRKIITAEIPVENGESKVDGDFTIDGVPGAGARIVLNFLDSAGAVTGKLLPTGSPLDSIEISKGRFTVSFVDSANPVIFVPAADLGLNGTELPAEMIENAGLMETLEEIRGSFAVRLGWVDSWQHARIATPAVPKICIVAPAQSYTDTENRLVPAGGIDITCRMMSMQRPHKAFAVTGAVCVGTAAKIPGSVVHAMLSEEARLGSRIRIGHPSGRLEVEVEVEQQEERILLRRAALARTARRIMDGMVYISRRKLASTQLAS